MMSQVDVPITRTNVCGVIPAPTAPMWQSKAPPATTTWVVKPKRSAHSWLKLPTGLSAVSVLSNKRSLNPPKSGSSVVKKSSAGKPPHFSCHIALCPQAQRLRTISLLLLTPVIKAGNHSQYSTIEYALARTCSSWRNT
ncbi:hypothetical protein SDC9_114233 [bioreactor metagenome]|uniref:Uncharacterized protein n=1 Tax=bioreactor metagenome TaxID=1076179 RepID=A0A645BRS1_9ZZZZ